MRREVRRRIVACADRDCAETIRYKYQYAQESRRAIRNMRRSYDGRTSRILTEELGIAPRQMRPHLQLAMAFAARVGVAVKENGSLAPAR